MALTSRGSQEKQLGLEKLSRMHALSPLFMDANKATSYPLYPYLAINNINTSCYTEGCALDLKTQVVGVEKVKELLKREPTATQQAVCLFMWTMSLHASLVAEQ